MTTQTISSDLRSVLRRLKLSPILSSLPERLTLARQQKMPHQDLLLLVLQDEVSRPRQLVCQPTRQGCSSGSTDPASRTGTRPPR